MFLLDLLTLTTTVKIEDFKSLCIERLEEAQALLDAHKLGGSEYLCGYAVELAVKYQICVTLGWESYPPKNSMAKDGIESFNYIESFKSHILETLLLMSGKYKAVYENGDIGPAWNFVKGWQSEMRYELSGKVDTDIENMINSTKILMKYFGVIT